MARSNQRQILKEISKQDSSIVRLAERIVTKHVKEVRADTLTAFNRHAVTEEIEEGSRDPTIGNKSNTLAGVGGNLFSFIGFFKGHNPIAPLRKILTDGISVSKPRKGKTSRALDYKFKVSTPTFSDLEQVAPPPFELGKSWIRGIETGITGLANYIFRRFIDRSRSSTGIQATNRLRSARYKPVPYLGKILKKMNKDIKNIKPR